MSARKGSTKTEDVKKGGWRMRSPRAADGVGASDICGRAGDCVERGSFDVD
jgi:hypothetical protein